ncbi:hypothetical protein, partial [Photobacterium sp. OFAV2-7]|uniref:hypothetical protein n=1 Tax=Photobacterium sp. OFAV2-7 TaxID=2917748 RepID=UPI001EF54443
MKNNEHVDVLIMCALKDEFEQLLNIDDGIKSPGWQKKDHSSGYVVADATFLTPDTLNLSIRATWSPFMGREEASVLTHKMLEDSTYRCLAMTGICAGRRGKVELGDVIFADRMWSYDSGKITLENGKEVFQGDQLQYRPKGMLVQRMQDLKIDTTTWPIQRPKLTLEFQEK